MNSTKELLRHLEDPNLSSNQRVQIRCQLARQLEEAGDYEAARETLEEFWQRVGERPVLDGLDAETSAEVLLRVGALTGWIGSAKQIEGAQEVAKDLINESSRNFHILGKGNKEAEAQADLAVCYWREGAFSEARVILQEAAAHVADTENETRAVISLRSAIVEMSAQRFHDALRIQTEAAPLFDKISNHLLKAKFHNEFANVLNSLSATEHREDYVDRALMEYTAASFHFEQAGHNRYRGCVENNLGFLFSTIGKFLQAHEHLDSAQMLFTSFKDNVHLAQVDETRARVMLKQGRLVEAEKTVRAAVRTLARGDELSLLAEALTTYGVVLARLHHPEQARSTMERAIDVAQQAGDLHSAGLAGLTIIEQLSEHLSNDELCMMIERAETLLEETLDMPTLKRLSTSACRALSRVHMFPARPDWSRFSLKEAMHRYEAHFIQLALKDTGGKVTPAAHLLGLPGHQPLQFILNNRHKDLLSDRTPVVPRKRSFTGDQNSDGVSHSVSKTRTMRILHVEDNQVVAGMVKETLENEGWQVEACADGSEALERITSDAHYDLLLLAYDLPGLNGSASARPPASDPGHRAFWNARGGSSYSGRRRRVSAQAYRHLFSSREDFSIAQSRRGLSKLSCMAYSDFNLRCTF
jgi:CheY-like chemotaxis protein/vacuolar-type H+-ATPase subunit H